ncbi:MAG: hypothetical protein OJF59_000964 [Cytophagales bacterium]|jgi:hypothetical protein|nr:outer membrane beta-barrel protein [Bacteroidota bacterium]MBS1980039.1 outer membrane beta-barrel protein [Bacteroidota bacterium]WHZ07211.1 MAG: hypothetical protein OJF59_000964 [Cytophagales bacterium]
MKTILLLLLSFISFAVSAQFTKGDKFLGGSLNISSQNGASYNPITNNRFSVGPQAGYFLTEKYALVAKLNYTGAFYETTGSKVISTSFSITPAVRRYFQISDKFFFNLDAYVGFSRQTDKLTNSFSNLTTQNPYYYLSAGIEPGFIFFPAPNWGFNASLGGLNYSHYQNLSTASTSNSIGLTWSSSLTFGVSYYFVTKK